LDILNGLKSYLHVYLSRDEINKLVQDLDEDLSGDIDFDEFDEKIDTDNLGERTHKFTISKTKFIEKMLGLWIFYKDRERKELLKLLKIDDRQSPRTIVDLENFSDLLKEVDPEVTKGQALDFYK
jgi:Ca2+-binding EF-hand superfamily protein